MTSRIDNHACMMAKLPYPPLVTPFARVAAAV
jgi:hypothetical protein